MAASGTPSDCTSHAMNSTRSEPMPGMGAQRERVVSAGSCSLVVRATRAVPVGPGLLRQLGAVLDKPPLRSVEVELVALRVLHEDAGFVVAVRMQCAHMGGAEGDQAGSLGF